EQISIADIRAADDMGYRIKLLGVAQITGLGLEQRMQPCLVPAASPLGQLDGGTNMVVIDGHAVDQVVLRGPGAGQGPTASAVLGDICDIARGLRLPTFGQPANSLRTATPARSTLPAAYYLRMQLVDKPGALAQIATVLGNFGISINRMRQYGHGDTTAAVLIVTHETTPDTLADAIRDMANTDVLHDAPVALRIELA
ncbi:MAG: ACT domain-containing protein, partial [Rhodobacteraceae bacterium]|nr:ACT domain-containing protein [Paracoccaceae bacterium]